MHVLPSGFNRIRHYGLLASGNRAVNIARGRQFSPCRPARTAEHTENLQRLMKCACRRRPCPAAGDACSIEETFARGCQPSITSVRRDENRHLMIPSLLIRNRSEHAHPGRSPARQPTCWRWSGWVRSRRKSWRDTRDPPVQPARNPASSRNHRIHSSISSIRTLTSAPTTDSAAAPSWFFHTAHSAPVFGRLLSERVDGLGIPASESLCTQRK